MSIIPQEPYDSDRASQDAWRDRFLQRILVLSAVVGLIALIPAVISTSQLILQSLYISVFVLVVAMILIRFPYMVKATIFILLPLILGFGSLTETGIRGDAVFFFLAFVTFSSLLIGTRAGIASLVITEIIIISMGYLVLSDQFTLSARLEVEDNLSNWASAAATHLLVSLVVLSALRMLNESFQETQQRAIKMHQSQLVFQKELEERVAERTHELLRKTHLLNASSIITHQTSVVQDLDRLLNRTVSLISENFGCYHVGIYLLNQRGDYVSLQAASSEGGKRLLDRGFRLRVGTEGIAGYVAAEKKPHIALDVGKDVIFFDNQELADTRSELTLPLLVRNKVVGVLDLQSSEINAFRYDEIDIFQSMADQVAVAIDNARLLTESQLMISQLEIISNENIRRNWNTELSTRPSSFRYSSAGVQPVEKPGKPAEKNTLAIPIILRGQKIGTILLQRKAEFQKWTAHEEAIASEVAAQTALALENIRLVERTRERANREQAISNISARIRETLDLDIVLRTSAREIQRALNLQEAEIRLIPQDNLEE